MKSKLIIFLSLIGIMSFTLISKPKKPKKNAEKTYELIEISTDSGSMVVWLYDATPLHKANMLKLANEGYYNGTTFHRIIRDFMIQGGDPNSKDADPNNDGMGGPNYTIPAEIRDTIRHERGAICAARTNNPEKASSGSQFYICHSTRGCTPLNGEYTVFGKVIKGVEIIDKIVSQPADYNDRPFTNIPMQVKVITKTRTQLKTEYQFTALR